jgi:hypothetical protein
MAREDIWGLLAVSLYPLLIGQPGCSRPPADNPPDESGGACLFTR